ncbi:DUF423 domain-containing protein [Sporolactobacillus spathodeae]|uniref:Uncharacterized membrane protein YgdD (TMEM256/DUF423 family) n=1 Tax=Sporolactobacillus spathodeae TaxID=1465502 RepID=A0ABS2Q9P3_9BACL|nr:DUF423 domain-containing protein [Sporolactobacillus spathodeae]MBM7658503.1 uncharacterized membrane protein YgdD (TMEM256/DUF423 family) [Sporolactobacillus spathodeae]
MKNFIVIGAALAFLSVALGAFGAHVLKERIGEHYLTIYQTGVQYQMFHSLGLMLIGLLALTVCRAQTGLLQTAAMLLIAGVVLFSGSLYVLSITRINWLGAITPFGGVAFLAAWACVIAAVVKS